MALREQMSGRHMQRPSQDTSFHDYMAHLQGGQASFNARSRWRSRQQQVADQICSSWGGASQAHEGSESEEASSTMSGSAGARGEAGGRSTSL